LSSAGPLALKLVLTPLLVGAASLAGRRWGSSVSGWLIGIPFTSAPIAFFVSLDQGQRFAAATALGVMAGAISQAVFCLGYAWTAQRSAWPASLGAATVGFAASTIVLTPANLPAEPFFVVVLVVLVVAIFLAPGRAPGAVVPVAFPWWDIPARMVAATGFVLVLTSAAPLLGPRLAGLIAPFPLYASVLAVFAHRMQGRDSAVGVVRGLLLGLFAFASFFLVLGVLLPAGTALAFLVAITVALVVQTASLFAGRGLGLA